MALPHLAGQQIGRGVGGSGGRGGSYSSNSVCLSVFSSLSVTYVVSTN